MNYVAIFFMPLTATQHDLERALREHLDHFDFVELFSRCRSGPTEQDDEALPLWQWFISEK